MDKIIRARGLQRGTLTKRIHEIETELASQDVDKAILSAKLELLSTTFAMMKTNDDQIVNLMLDANATDGEMEVELDKVAEYEEKYVRAKQTVQVAIGTPAPTSSSTSASVSSQVDSARILHLPKLNIRTFSGEPKEYLGFWAQFRQIHDDQKIDDAVKFVYFAEKMEKDTAARRFVDRFEQTGSNYQRMIDAFKSRFGADDLLGEVYTRELLKLVINNASQALEKFDLAKLHDELESHLSNLETLKLKTAANSTFLFPMVESCLPATLILAWKRSDLYRDQAKTKLENLMAFLSLEVENEQRISLAREGFGSKANPSPIPKPVKERRPSDKVPTAIGLVNSDSQKCLFCDRKHRSVDCRTAMKWTLAERKAKVQSAGVCYGCLQRGHISRRCTAKDLKCGICSGRHHRLMCFQEGSSDSSTKDAVVQLKTEVDPGSSSQTMANSTSAPEVLMQTLTVNALNGPKLIPARVILDSASQRSYVTKELIGKLGYVTTGTISFTHQLFGGRTTTTVQHDRYKLFLRSQDNRFGCNFDVYDEEIICSNIPQHVDKNLISALRAKNVVLTNCQEKNGKVDILIGADVLGKLLTGRLKQVTEGITAIETKLGWTVMGKSHSTSRSTSFTTAMSMNNFAISDLWELEKIGIMDPSEKLTRKEADEETKRFFRDTVSRESDGRYTVKLPFIPGHPKIPCNRDVALARLKATTRKLTKEKNLEDYSMVFREWLEVGIIEPVPETDSNLNFHYLPHRPVFKPDSATTKVRPVFDASCKGFNGKSNVSLNQCLEKGPNMLDLIPDLLLRFREKPVAVTADIKKAFLMINVEENDRDYLRFLWWDTNGRRSVVGPSGGPDANGPGGGPDGMGGPKEYRHARVVFGVNSSPFLLAAVLEHHLSQVPVEKHEVAQKLLESMYVDNLLSSFDTIEEYEHFKEEAIKIMKEAKFDLRLWENNVSGEEPTYTSVLGVCWDRHSDVLHCQVKDRREFGKEVTKRSILSAVSRIFDPIGILAPFTLIPKILLQSTWNEKLDWNDPVNPETARKFEEWYAESHFVELIKIPRHAQLSGKDKLITLHVFCDASSKAYAAIVFARIEYGHKTDVVMLDGKARVAPMKVTTINRLELIACEIGARIITKITQALKRKDLQVILWSDSGTALAWVRRNENWGTFVGNRVRKILEVTQAEQWRHVPGEQNPADLLSRGCGAKRLLETKFWNGPDWLRCIPSEWPSSIPNEDETEIMHEKKKTVQVLINHSKSQWYYPDKSRFSRFSSHVKIMGYVWRFIARLRKRSRQGGPTITMEERRHGELWLCKLIQSESFSTETKFPFDVKKDGGGVLRVATRMMSEEETCKENLFRFPVLLPSKHVLVEQLILEEHERNCHAEPQFLMSKLREKFWILKGRKTIERVLRKCVICRRYKSHHPVPAPGPLPENRIKGNAAFKVVGVDFAGPMFLKDKKKVWICLFTCALYRGVHLELATALSTEAFLLCLRRFVARFGRPDVIYSDNGTNFVGTNATFSKLNWSKIEEEAGIRQINWKFGPPASPWWNGFFERMVRSVKELLIRMLGRSILNYEELQTVLLDVEATINARPLTYVYENDLLIPLTPSHFIHGVTSKALDDVDHLDRHEFGKRYRFRQTLLEGLRSRFKKEYLTTLTQRSGKLNKVAVNVGDVVIIGSDNKKRIMWPTGLVEEILPGRDGVGRVAKVKTSNGVLLRPLQRLYPLEVSVEETEKMLVEAEKAQPEVVKDTEEKADEKTQGYRTKFGRLVKPVKITYN